MNQVGIPPLARPALIVDTVDAKPSTSPVGAAVRIAASAGTRRDLRATLTGKGVQDTIQAARAAGLYRAPIPNNQDGLQNKVSGLGGKFVDAMPVYVFSPRRQTDQMVRQAYRLLPSELKRDVAFVNAQRLAQDPEGAVRSMYGKKEVVIVGSFKGINKATSRDPEVEKIHVKEMTALRLSLQLARAMGVKVCDVVYGMGDSSPMKSNGRFVQNNFGNLEKNRLQGQMRSVLSSYGYNRREDLLWGADELMVSAFAAQLPRQTLSVTLQNPQSKSYYDNNVTAEKLVVDAAEKVGLTIVPRGQSADIELRAFTLEPDANTASDQAFPDRKEFDIQHRSDMRFARSLQRLNKSSLARTVVIDARLANGALDDTSLPPSTDVLGYSAWGSVGNNFGQGLAMAKIISFARNQAEQSGGGQQRAYINAARRQLLIESIAHDQFFIGQLDGAGSAIHRNFRGNALGAWLHGNRLPTAPGETLSEDQLVGLYRAATSYANQRLQRKYPGLTGFVSFSPQPFNRRFEASTAYSKGVVPEAGSISSELLQKYPEFDPGRVYRGYEPDPQIGDQAVGSNGNFYYTKSDWFHQIKRKLGF